MYIDTFCSFFTLQTWSLKKKQKKLHLVCLHLFRSETEGLASLGSGKRWAPLTRPWCSLKSPLWIGLWETPSIHGRTLWLINGGLVGGWTNPSEKYESKWVHLPQIGMKIKKYLKPPPRGVPNYLHPLGAHPPSKRTPLTQNCIISFGKHGPNCGGARPLELRSSNYHYQPKQSAIIFGKSRQHYHIILSWFDPPKKGWSHWMNPLLKR